MRIKVNRLDRYFLRGRDPNEPITRLEMLRLRGVVALALAIAVFGFSIMLWAYQRQIDSDTRQHRNQVVAACEARNEQSLESKRIYAELSKLEIRENQAAEQALLRLATRSENTELKLALTSLAALEAERDKSVAMLFGELADEIKIIDCGREIS